MIQLTSDQWMQWLSLGFWPLLRVLALISTAPILSERSVPKRAKLGLGLMITLAIAPMLPPHDVPIFSYAAVWVAIQQILIGIALGFTMQFAFAAVRTAGRLSACRWVIVCNLCRSCQSSQYASAGAHSGYAGFAAISDI